MKLVLRATIVLTPLAFLVAGAWMLSPAAGLLAAGVYTWIELRPIWSATK